MIRNTQFEKPNMPNLVCRQLQHYKEDHSHAGVTIGSSIFFYICSKNVNQRLSI